MTTGISELIVELKGSRTYKQLEEDCGGVPSYSRLNSMVHRPVQSMPSVEVIQGLSRGLGVNPAIVVDAVGRTLGLWETGMDASPISLPAGAETLTSTQKAAVVGVVREFVRANQVAP